MMSRFEVRSTCARQLGQPGGTCPGPRHLRRDGWRRAWPIGLSVVALAMGCRGNEGAASEQSSRPPASAAGATGSASGSSHTAASPPTATSGSSAVRARPAQLGLDAEGRPQPSDEDRCAMCGMKVTDHRDWAGAIETGGGETFYFCGPRCTVATSRHSDRFLGVAPGEIGRIRVTDYLHPERSLDAKEAFYVVDSDVRGPMGLALLPAATQADADTLVKRHGGRVVRYADANDALLMDLKQRSRSAAPSPPPH